MDTIYLDHSATTPVRQDVLDAMWPFFSQNFGNPSSVHSAGAVPREALHRAHSMVADVLHCREGEVVFTGGGTESDNLAILGVAHASRDRGNGIVTSRIEHDAVLNACGQLEREGFRVTYLPVDGSGTVDLGALRDALDDSTVLVSIMLANNEIGTIQPMQEISRVAKEFGALVHTDAVQAAAHMNLDVDDLGVDLLSISAHKFYGPKGVGALYVRRGTPLLPSMHGGGQERGRRSGTENVAGVVGLAVALALADGERHTEVPRLTGLRDRLITGLLERVPGTHLTGHATHRLPGHVSMYLDGLSGESVLVNLDMAGVACSSGSACQAGSTHPSHVLTAIGVPDDLAKNALRMSLGRGTTREEVDYVLDVMPSIVDEIRHGVAV